MKILGLNTIGFNTSASLVINGKLIGSIEEERLNREKERESSIKSISYLLNKNNLKFEQIDALAISWNPLINLEKFNFSQSEDKSFIPNITFSVPSYVLKLNSYKTPDFFVKI